MDYFEDYLVGDLYRAKRNLTLRTFPLKGFAADHVNVSKGEVFMLLKKPLDSELVDFEVLYGDRRLCLSFGNLVIPENFMEKVGV